MTRQIEQPDRSLQLQSFNRNLRCEVAMLRPACYAIGLSLLMAGCSAAPDPVQRHGTLVKICPHLRTVYSWQNKLYLKEGNRYRQVDGTGIDDGAAIDDGTGIDLGIDPANRLQGSDRGASIGPSAVDPTHKQRQPNEVPLWVAS